MLHSHRHQQAYKRKMYFGKPTSCDTTWATISKLEWVHVSLELSERWECSLSRGEKCLLDGQACNADRHFPSFVDGWPFPSQWRCDRVIEEIIVLGSKQYGYWFIDQNGNRVERSVLAGIGRDSVPFEELRHVFNGNQLIKPIKGRFYTSLSDQSITSKDVNMTISFNPNKKLVGNRYVPIKI